MLTPHRAAAARAALFVAASVLTRVGGLGGNVEHRVLVQSGADGLLPLWPRRRQRRRLRVEVARSCVAQVQQPGVSGHGRQRPLDAVVRLQAVDRAHVGHDALVVRQTEHEQVGRGDAVGTEGNRARLRVQRASLVDAQGLLADIHRSPLHPHGAGGIGEVRPAILAVARERHRSAHGHRGSEGIQGRDGVAQGFARHLVEHRNADHPDTQYNQASMNNEWAG